MLAIRDPRLWLAGWRIGRHFGPVECQRVFHWIGKMVLGAGFSRERFELVLRDTLILAGSAVNRYPTIDYNGLIGVVASHIRVR